MILINIVEVQIEVIDERVVLVGKGQINLIWSFSGQLYVLVELGSI